MTARLASRLAYAMLVALAAFAAPAALAQTAEPKLSPADWNAIRAVVADQRDAIVAGDAVRAFAYASPGIRRQFGDAPTFLAMIRRAYSALVEAREATPLEGAVIDGDVIQPLRLVMPDDTVLIALYAMAKDRSGAWRIAGCVIAPSTLRAT